MFIFIYAKFDLKVFLHNKVYKYLLKHLEKIFFYVSANVF